MAPESISKAPNAPAQPARGEFGRSPNSNAPPKAARDLVELTKPRITLMVLVTAALGFVMAAEGPLPVPLLLVTLLGTGLVASGASALNQVVERETDARMRRTADRPLPSGRMNPDVALAFGVVLSISGLLILAFGVNLLTAVLGAVALLGYVFVYTPMKRTSSLSTLVGAVPGAIPPMMGWTARAGELEPGAWAFFGILFLWQLPHFLAIAWLCRHDYAEAGFPMLPTVDSDGRRTARQMILYCAALLPVSLLPSVLGVTGTPYLIGAVVLGLLFLATCLAFWRSFSSKDARRVVLASVVYLPAVLLVALLDRLV